MKRMILIAMVGAIIFLCQPVFAFVPQGGNTYHEVQAGLSEYNFAPAFVSTGPVIRRVIEGSVDTFTESVSDPDGDTFSVTLVGSPPAWVTLTKIATGFEIRSTPGINTAGVYNFSIRAMDALGGQRDKDVIITVTKTVAQGIQILSYSPTAGTVTVNETDSAVFFIEAKSLDGKTLTYRWTSNGVDQGIGTPGFGLMTTFDDAGTHQVKVVVSDGSTSVQQIWTLVVNNVNRPPVFATMPQQIEGIVGEQIALNPQATDPDNDPLTFSAQGPVGGILVNQTWTWVPPVSGVFSVIFTVTDVGGLSDSQTVTITVVGGDTTTDTTLIHYGTEVHSGIECFFVQYPIGYLNGKGSPHLSDADDWNWLDGTGLAADFQEENQKFFWNESRFLECGKWTTPGFQILTKDIATGNVRGLDEGNSLPADWAVWGLDCGEGCRHLVDPSCP